MDILSIAPELYSAFVRRQVVSHLKEYFALGYRDPELLYMGARYALSLGLNNDARAFLDPLTQMLCQNGTPSPAYFPVGLLAWLAISPEPAQDNARQEIYSRLTALAQKSSRLQHSIKALSIDGVFAQAKPTHESPPQTGDALLARVHALAQKADVAYKAKDLLEARKTLEDLLVLDGDQPDVLRNLVSLASEQGDIEAYERYWRRYVKLLLWRVLRGDEALSAWDDLTAFYLKSAMLMDVDLAGQQKEILELLRRPGFLSRWLETHAGLVWMQITSTKGEGYQLREYWFRSFYPEVAPFVALSAEQQELARQTQRVRSVLPYDPTLKLLTRFCEWAVFGFALRGKSGEDDQRSEKEINPHLDSVKALCGFVSRMSLTPYLQDLAGVIDKIPEEQRSNRRSVRRYIQDSCSLGYQGFAEYLNKEDFKGLVNYLSEPAKYGNLSPYLSLFLALAQCKVNQEAAAFDLALAVAPDLQEDEVKEDAQTRHLWVNVLHAYLMSVLNPKKKMLVQMEVKNTAAGVQARIVLIPDHKADHLVKFKKDMQHEVDEVVDQVLLNVIIEQTIAETKKLVGNHRFSEARTLIRNLPDQPDEVKQLKKNLLDQIKDAEDSYNINQKIESTIAATKKAVEGGNFYEARRLVRALPDSPKEVADLKVNLLNQIDQAETQHNAVANTNYEIEQVIEQVKTLVGRRDFREARRVIRSELPYFPGRDQLEQNLLNQIDEVERMSRYR